MQPPSDVLSPFLFCFYQVGVVTDTHRNVEVSGKVEAFFSLKFD